MLRYAIFASGVLGALYLSYGVSSLILLLNNSQMASPEHNTVSMTEAPEDEYGYLDLGNAASAEDLLADTRAEDPEQDVSGLVSPLLVASLSIAVGSFSILAALLYYVNIKVSIINILTFFLFCFQAYIK